MTDLEHRTGGGHGSGGPGNEIATVDDARFPVADPGEPEHLPRLTDVDEDAADRATRQVATMFGIVPILALIFVVSYFAIPKTAYIDFGPLHSNLQHIIFGLTLGLALVLIGTGAIQWARQLMDDHEAIDYRHGASSSDEERKETVALLEQGIAESGITRRKVLGRSLLGALGLIALPAVVLFADLGPWPTRKFIDRTIATTIWKEGIRLVNDVTYVPIKADQVQIGQLVNAQPENLQDLHGTEFLQEKAKASIIVVRMNPNTIKIPPLAPGLARRRNPVLLQDLHPRRVPDQPVGTADAPPAVPLPPVDVRSGRLRRRGLRTRRAVVAPAPDHRRRRGVSRGPGRLQRAHRSELLRAGLPQRLPAG